MFTKLNTFLKFLINDENMRSMMFGIVYVFVGNVLCLLICMICCPFSRKNKYARIGEMSQSTVSINRTWMESRSFKILII